MHRVGVFPFKRKNNNLVMLFVSSQTRGRWILPKGRLKTHETALDGCHREAFEEAGIRGTILGDFPITAPISRATAGGLKKIPVTYYPMLVDDFLKKWPEQNHRERQWVKLQEAKNRIPGRDILDVVKRFERLLPWINQAADEILEQKHIKLKLVT